MTRQQVGDLFRKYEVEASGVAGFIDRYYKASRRKDTTLSTYEAEFQRDGWTFITHHSSNTGRTVAYFREGGINGNN